MDKICFFAGHREIYEPDNISEKVKAAALHLIEEKGVCEFMVGNYGMFDKLCARVIANLKNEHPHIKLHLVIPYLTKEINENSKIYHNKFDEIIIADIPESTPKSLKIIKCNQYMTDKSDFMICYVKSGFGGARTTLDYANKKKNMKIYNLFESL